MTRKSRKGLPSDLPRRRVHNALRRLGFFVAREGSKHTIYSDGGKPERLLAIPRHAKVSRRLLLGELKRIGVSAQQFMAEY